jgi:hypothetical protein
MYRSASRCGWQITALHVSNDAWRQGDGGGTVYRSPPAGIGECVRVERDEVFLELTRSICPLCKRVVDAEVNIRENKVVLRKRRPEHGPFEALVYSDAELYMSQLRSAIVA